jgi:tetratricopeptide (TPR) repeat protein
MLRASERDLPDDYNPPARLALAYKALKNYDEALAASDRALAKAYGPRKLGILQTRADIYKDKGDSAAARKTIEEAVKVAESLPDGQRSERAIASLKKKLETLPQ